MPAIITKGGMSASGFGFGASAQGPVYIEDVFSTYIYTATGSNTIVNGIDLVTYGGMIWVKSRSSTQNNQLLNTVNGNQKVLNSDTTDYGQSYNYSFLVYNFNVNGFTDSVSGRTGPYSSWTFRKQPKFFTICTWTGDGVNGRQISHDLGSTPGMIIVKRTNAASNWQVYHRSLTSAANSIQLNLTNAQASAPTVWNSTAPTSSVFSVGTDATVNASGGTYVAYLFAHNAGGFGATGTDNVVSCGSFTTDSLGAASVTLGWEPQFVLIKRFNVSAGGSQDNWQIVDNMRGLGTAGTTQGVLFPNTADSEFQWPMAAVTATGFATTNAGYVATNSSFIYLAIRRGPMKTPTNATTVFSPITSSAATGTKLTTNFPVDLQIFSARALATNKGQTVDRLRGISSNTTESGTQLVTTSTAAETTTNTPTRYWDNTGFQMPSIYAGNSMVFWNFGRAPGFMDVVCYTGTGSAMTITHGLGVVPEMIITKSRSASGLWAVYHQFTGPQNYLQLSTTARAIGYAQYYTTAPTSTSYTQGTDPEVTGSGRTFVVYLFASCPGVSKVGSYTGTGAAQNIGCGFAAAARFVLIKRTDTTGDWWCYDSARGITAANDPYLFWNSNAAEVTSTDYVNAFATGFGLTSTAPAGLNANGGTYIYLAIA